MVMLDAQQFFIQNCIIIKKIYQQKDKTSMNIFDGQFDYKSPQEYNHCLINLDELYYDRPQHLDLNYGEKNDQQLDPTNFIQKYLSQHLLSGRPLNFIELSKYATNSYIHTKKGLPNQTMELLPNFKTFCVRKIKELLLIKVLSKEQTKNCLIFMKDKPSFESLNSLLNPIEKCRVLQSALLEYLSSSSIIREIMQSRIRIEQKKKLIKFINRMREKVENPGKNWKWKQQFQ